MRNKKSGGGMFDWMTRPESTTISLGTERRKGRSEYQRQRQEAKVLKAQQKAQRLQAKKDRQHLRSHDYAVEQLKENLLQKVSEYEQGGQQFLDDFHTDIVDKHIQYIQNLKKLVNNLKSQRKLFRYKVTGKRAFNEARIKYHQDIKALIYSFYKDALAKHVQGIPRLKN